MKNNTRKSFSGYVTESVATGNIVRGFAKVVESERSGRYVRDEYGIVTESSKCPGCGSLDYNGSECHECGYVGNEGENAKKELMESTGRFSDGDRVTVKHTSMSDHAGKSGTVTKVTERKTGPMSSVTDYEIEFDDGETLEYSECFLEASSDEVDEDASADGMPEVGSEVKFKGGKGKVIKVIPDGKKILVDSDGEQKVIEIDDLLKEGEDDGNVSAGDTTSGTDTQNPADAEVTPQVVNGSVSEEQKGETGVAFSESPDKAKFTKGFCDDRECHWMTEIDIGHGAVGLVEIAVAGDTVVDFGITCDGDELAGEELKTAERYAEAIQAKLDAGEEIVSEGEKDDGNFASKLTPEQRKDMLAQVDNADRNLGIGESCECGKPDCPVCSQKKLGKGAPVGTKVVEPGDGGGVIGEGSSDDIPYDGKFIVEIDCGADAAFSKEDAAHEVKRILDRYLGDAESVQSILDGHKANVFSINGNRVGKIRFEA